MLAWILSFQEVAACGPYALRRSAEPPRGERLSAAEWRCRRPGEAPGRFRGLRQNRGLGSISTTLLGIRPSHLDPTDGGPYCYSPRRIHAEIHGSGRGRNVESMSTALLVGRSIQHWTTASLQFGAER